MEGLAFNTVEVAAGVINNAHGLILIALRPQHADLGGLWEFPGGKVEQDETLEAALSRELDEEIGIEVVQASPLLRITHTYPTKTLLLHVYQVTHFKGDPVGREGQELRWVTLDELVTLPFPAANQAIIEELQIRR
jgi:8-oxo-dGTP diphosphatase